MRFIDGADTRSRSASSPRVCGPCTSERGEDGELPVAHRVDRTLRAQAPREAERRDPEFRCFGGRSSGVGAAGACVVLIDSLA